MLIAIAVLIALGLAAVLVVTLKRGSDLNARVSALQTDLTQKDDQIGTLQVDLAKQQTLAGALEESLTTAREDAARERALAAKERKERLDAEDAAKQLKELRDDVVATRKQAVQTATEAGEARKAVEQESNKATQAVQGLVSRYTRPKGRGQLSEGWLGGIFEGAGLREGVSYDRERRVAIEKPDGETAIGVIDYYLRLPGGSGIALDAKYPFARAEDLVSDNDVLRKKARDDLRSSLRAHIKGLSERRYQDARDCQVDGVFLVLPSWEDYALARGLAPDLWDYARSVRVSIVPADGVFEIAESVALVHRLADTTGKIARLHDPVAIDRMFDTSLNLLDCLVKAVESHNMHGNHLDAIVRSFASQGKFRRDVLDVLGDAANRVDAGKQPADVRDLSTDRARQRHQQLQDKADELRGGESATG